MSNKTSLYATAPIGVSYADKDGIIEASIVTVNAKNEVAEISVYDYIDAVTEPTKDDLIVRYDYSLRRVVIIGDVTVVNSPGFQEYWAPANRASFRQIEQLFVFEFIDESAARACGVIISANRRALIETLKKNGWL